ncbi:hypothetical protein JQN63_14410 [Delftia lacustris]|uniref:hypothetical protein n=1 Tax=Delftia lacustris TaxID=558537 RepID=UPI00193B705A|nr:hypothetical protein [Delftia lacustris]QRI92994.1 hypothetical protein JQN63_14410 [Delftia lacustris]
MSQDDTVQPKRRWRLAKALLWSLAAIAAAVAANVVGIALIGSIDGWQRWLHHTAPYFLVWRLGLYGALIYAWLRVRRTQLAWRQRGPARQQLRRAEIAALLALAVQEISVFVGSP